MENDAMLRIVELLESIDNRLKVLEDAKKPKKKASKKIKEDDVREDVKKVQKLYKDYGLRGSGLTLLAKESLEEVIDKHGEDKVVDAVKYATTTWYANPEMGDGNKGTFRNIAWFCKNINNFMEGGKYWRKEIVKNVKTSNIDILG